MLRNSPLWVKRVKAFTLLVMLIVPLMGAVWALSRIDTSTGQELIDEWYTYHKPTPTEIDRLAYWLQKDPSLIDRPYQLRKLLNR